MNAHDEMSDNDVLRVVGDSVSGMTTARPPDVGAIMARGRARRRRRLVPGAAGALALAAGAALAVTAPASHQPTAELAAWTVARQADGTVYVTIREVSDPAGLQSTLRADGVPASVTFSGQENPACQPYLWAPGTGPSQVNRDLNRIYQPPPGGSNVMVIRPSALPGGAGVQISAAPGAGGGQVLILGASLVQASEQCTGS